MSVQISHTPRNEEGQPLAAGRTSIRDWVPIIPVVISLSAIILYFAGWTYLYAYYSIFGLSLNEVNFDLREIMVYGFLVYSRAFEGWAYFRAVLVVLALGCGWFLQKKWTRGRRRRILAPDSSGHDSHETPRSTERWLWAGVYLWLIILLPFPMSRLSLRYGRNDADRDMREDLTDLPMVSLVIDKGKLPQPLFTDTVTDGLLEGFRLLAHGKSGYYLFKPIHKETANPRGTLNVVFIPYSAVLGDKIGIGIPGEVK